MLAIRGLLVHTASPDTDLPVPFDLACHRASALRIERAFVDQLRTV
jgi:hypothetical protein